MPKVIVENDGFFFLSCQMTITELLLEIRTIEITIDMKFPLEISLDKCALRLVFVKSG